MELYKHNQTAYEAALALLHKTGKAAVIHPTGTGKSFIACKLCEDHPEDAVCWLSPSEYIFRTQMENWRAAGGGELHNVCFLTYAKLMRMEADAAGRDTGITSGRTDAAGEASEIPAEGMDFGEAFAGRQPRFIVLDEFHRCGAALWGQGVRRLLAAYPDAMLLGLTATGIRYLDNQRDMAAELFDGNVASEISLGDAVVRGILNPPKYVLSAYSYQKDIERLQERIRRTRNLAVRDAADEYLEALRRALEKADGLDVVFDRHMPDRTGKYIVFCSNAEHMREMMELSSEWFGKIDRNPHIYSVYSSDPTASQLFADFKADDDRAHLRLLYCIDALNEGIHLEDVSGVILLRPTVSPIVFKQQIGRALSAGKKKDAVIFDIVMNINNLCSIGAVEEEMQTAAAYYRSLGEEDEVVQEHFRIIDEVQDCRILFEKLGEVLGASWTVMYGQAQHYYMENGDLEVPARYVTEDGYSLGHWIYNQRYIRKGVLDGDLTEEKIAKLDAIGMRWEVQADAGWERNYRAAKKYYEENGHLDVPVKYRAGDGTALGQWLSSLRTWEKAGAHPKYLTAERKGLLEEIGMVWDKTDRVWERNYRAACAYYMEYGNLDVPSSYVDADGIRLGVWIGRMRKLRKGARNNVQDKRAGCDGGRNRRAGTDSSNCLVAGADTDKAVEEDRRNCRAADTGGKGSPAGAAGQGKYFPKGLTQEQIGRLDAIGMVWEKRTDQAWEKGFSAAEGYALVYGNLLVPASYETADGVKLGTWIQRQRLLYKKKTLRKERIQRLETIGMVWDTQPWMVRFHLAEQYYRENGTLDIPQSEVTDGCWIGKWIVTQKRLYDEGKLTGEQRMLLAQLPLEQVGNKDAGWQRLYRDAAAFYRENGSLKVPQGYVGESGFRLADWLVRQRRARKLGELSEERIRLLDELGFRWRLGTQELEKHPKTDPAEF